MILLPNFGAEEGDEGGALSRPPLRALARAWRLLFGADARILGVERDEGVRYEAPVWPFLPTSGGVAWLSTPAAARRLRRLGAPLVGPSPGVVARIHDKAFAARREENLPIRVFDPEALQPDAVREALTTFDDETPWVLKPRFGSSGRGRTAGRGKVLRSEAEAALSKLARRGGAVLEPWLQRTLDLSAQLYVDDEVRLLGITRLVATPTGVPVGIEGIESAAGIVAGTPWDERVAEEALRLGEELKAAGFSGACGVDAFVYRDAGGERLRPAVEVNARFTMGTVALGLFERAKRQGLRGGRFAFGWELPREGDRWDLGGGLALSMG